MKKIYTAIIIILAFNLFFPLFVNAESQSNDNGNGFAYVTTGLNYGSPDGYYTATVYSDYKICVCKERTNGNNYYVLTAGLLGDDEPHICYIDSVQYSKNIRLISADNYHMNQNYYITGYMNNNENFSWNWSFIMSPTYASNQTAIPLFETFAEAEEYILSPDIDFDTIYYNPQIPVPKLNIWYLYQVESYREDGVANFTANIDVPDSTEFYVQLAWKYSYPQNIRVYSSDMKGTPAYDYELYKSSDLISIYSLQDMQQAINLHVTGSDLNTAWQDEYDGFIDGVTFYTNQSNAPANWLSTARLNYVNKMATQIPLYGNRLEVFARYWTLTEDNQVVVGKWYHWQSAKGSATEDVPETYVNYQELPGYAGTVENVPTNDENTYTGTGESTGEQATTVINYAPNYPDYPTAVSYNHDNILLQMIQTSKQLPQFFGQFTNFLAITLAFIDPGVWAIIGFGFTCCIVIMIIKIL